MDLSALRIFLAVAEERSFSRAAAKVHRTQPAVSQAVRRLELDLGEELFDRSSKSGTLTDAGRVLQNYGQRLVRLAGGRGTASRGRGAVRPIVEEAHADGRGPRAPELRAALGAARRGKRIRDPRAAGSPPGP